MASIIIGTAGHIDHGKSALVRALTGTDPDRLREEQERGLTIDLGFAFLSEEVAFIDVPGHERFIKNMVAGVSTVDFVLFVVAADDGVMPQTREHLDILNVLQLKRGIIAVTKIDLVEPDWVELVHEDIRQLTMGTFLENAPFYDVSSVTGQGIDELKNGLLAQIKQAPPRKDRGIFWLPVDRSFTMKGFGTVVTGSVLSGKTHVGESLELLPQKRTVRVRGLHSHGHKVDEVSIGMRAAINLVGVEKSEVQRGDVLVTLGYYVPANILDARLRLLKSARKPLQNRTRVRIHLGTREVIGRVILLDSEVLEPGADAYVQLRLEKMAVASRLEPFVIRQYSPAVTIGGGAILDPNAKRHRRFEKSTLEHLQSLQREDPIEVVEGQLLAMELKALKVEEIATQTGLQRSVVQNAVSTLLEQGKIFQVGSQKSPAFVHVVHFDTLKRRILETLTQFHEREPLRLGVSKAELVTLVDPNLSNQVLDKAVVQLINAKEIEEKGATLKLTQHEITLSPEDEALCEKLNKVIQQSGFATPSVEEMCEQVGVLTDKMAKLLGAMQGRGDVLKLEGELYFHPTRVNEAKEKLRAFFADHEELSVSEFRELLGTSRKYAMALLIYFDDMGVTERVGEYRILGRKG